MNYFSKLQEITNYCMNTEIVFESNEFSPEFLNNYYV